jgi:hypothetical protein
VNPTTVTVLRYPDPDNIGRRTGTPTERSLAGCVVGPRTEGLGSSSDVVDRNRDGAVELLTIWCNDINADVKQSDRIRLTADGPLYTPEGVPARWDNPHTGSQPGCVIHIRRTIG